ncbi:ras-specific guanine nucleotide-releasing factor 1-like isoform X1 [Branchiostoma floridae]|uniref:Ras-specific guanine nucleotide-releasing factor 1-like isoform X1 n=1 Tax=Branchiostoma floridae TaxID=7739 RepID=A0A9J7KN92_BRAFL|nr:ras-specific guanine nucleotide-releasing factor 1-like isoform X1 [Branchiostoma floridae]
MGSPPTIPEHHASTKRVRSHSTTTLPTILSEDRGDNGRAFESNEHIRRHPLRRSFRRNKCEGDQQITEDNMKEEASQERLGTPIHHRSSSPALPVPCRRRSASSTGPVDESGRGRSPSPAHRPSSPVPPSSPRLVHAESAPGVVVTSSRPSRRRSTSSAVVAFAAATAGSANLRVSDGSFSTSGYGSCITSSPDLKQQRKNKEEIISTAATARVLNVLRHWTTKHKQDFEMDSVLKAKVVELLEEMMGDVGLLASEHKAASNILRTLAYEDGDKTKARLQEILSPGKRADSATFETLSALQLAEQLTLTDHTIFCSIPYEEFLNKAWMKPDKATRAPHIMLTSKRFNEVSKLVASEVVSQPTIPGRASAIEKWTAVADICRCMHNYNSVLEITSAFQNSAIYRLKKTWEKVSKQTKQLVEKLKNLVSSDGRFKNMRNELHRCDPPCVPYLGVYLTDLAFIEDGAPNFTEDGLVNFSKMRMIAHVIRELRQYQQTPYKIEYDPKVTSYLLDQALILDDDALYAASLQIEPRMSPSASASSGS